MQLLSIPPHAHDIHQMVEHGIGCSKGHTGQELTAKKHSLDSMSHAELQQLVYAGAQKYTAASWDANVHRWIQCLRIISTPADQQITVYKRKMQNNGEIVDEPVDVQGTNGSYCHKTFS